MKDIDINMHGLGLLFVPLVGTKMAKSRFWSVPPLRVARGGPGGYSGVGAVGEGTAIRRLAAEDLDYPSEG